MGLIAQYQGGCPQELRGAVLKDIFDVNFIDGQVFDNLNIGDAWCARFNGPLPFGTATVNGIISRSLDGRPLSILAAPTSNVIVAAEAASSLAPNRFALNAGSILKTSSTADYVWDLKTQRWSANSTQAAGLSMSVTLSAAQLLALSGTPVQILPAPGAGLYTLPTFFSLEYIFGTVAYSTPLATNGCFLTWTIPIVSNPPNYALLFTWGTWIKSLASVLATGACGNSPIALASVVNKPLYFGAPNALTLGNGKLVVTVNYSILPA